jgi:hypothetical protein
MKRRAVARIHDRAMPGPQLTDDERAAVWNLLYQLPHRQHPWPHAGVVFVHQGRCATYVGGKCDCIRKPELDLPGKN